MFIRTNFQFARSIPNSPTQGEGLTSVQNTYRTISDTLATVVAPGYFPNNFDENSLFVIPGDTILINASDAIGMFEVLTTAPVTFGPNLLTSAVSPTFHAQVVVISGADITPPPSFTSGITIRGNNPVVGQNIVAGSATIKTELRFQDVIVGDIGVITASRTGFVTLSPEIGIANVNNLMIQGGVFVNNSGIVTIVLTAHVDTINERTPANGTVINGIKLDSTGITFPAGLGGGVIGHLQNTDAIAFNWTGLWATPRAAVCNVEYFNKMVTLTFKGVPQTVAVSGGAATSSIAVVPAYARPLTAKRIGILVIDGGFVSPGLAVIETTGIVNVYATISGGGFGGIADDGFYDFSITYDPLI